MISTSSYLVWANAILAGLFLFPIPKPLLAQLKSDEAPSERQPLQDEKQGDETLGSVVPAETPMVWSLQIRFVTMPSAEFKNLQIDWLQTTVSEKLENLGSESAVKQNRVSSSVSSRSVGEKNVPFIYATVDTDEMNAMLRQARENQRTVVLNAPLVKVPDNQLASIENETKTPQAPGNQEVQSVYSGTIVNVRPSSQANDVVRLNCDVTISGIRSLELREVPLTGSTKAFIEVPEVAKTTIQCALDLPFHDSLVLGRIDKETKDSTVILITCEPSKHAAQRIPIADQTALVQSAEVQQDCVHRSGDRNCPVVVMGPLEGIGSIMSEALPSDDEIVHAFEKNRSTIHSTTDKKMERRIVRISKEKVQETAEPARFVPLIGHASLHHAIYKCKIAIGKTNLLSSTPEASNEEHSLYVDYTRFRMVE